MDLSFLRRWIPRAVLAYVIALPVFVVTAAKATEGQQNYVMTVRMKTMSPGLLQVFTDTGHDFTEAESYTAALTPSNEPHDYQLFLPPGRYKVFRIDPGTGPG